MDRNAIAYALTKQVPTVYQVQSAYGPLELDEELAAVVGIALRKCLQHRLDEIDGAGDWQPMSTAPKDGTWIQAEIPGHGADNVIAWCDGFMNAEEQPCSCWCFMTEQEPPDDWTDGVCWESNEDEVPSTPPVRWKPIPPNRLALAMMCERCEGMGSFFSNSAARHIGCPDCDGTGRAISNRSHS